MRLTAVLVAAALSFHGVAHGAELAHWVCTDTLALTGADGAAIEPAGLVCDAFGVLWVSDGARHRLLRWDGAGRRLDETGSLGSESNQFRHPGALARWGASAVVVLDRENRRVVAYDTHGRRSDFVVDLAASALEQQAGRIEAVGLAADGGGALYVADSDRDRVLVFDFAGRFQRALGGYGNGPGTFHHLVALAASPKGGLLTLEWLAAGKLKSKVKGAVQDSAAGPRVRVQRLESDGSALGQWEFACGDAPSLAITADDAGRVAVSDVARGEVRLFESSGVLAAHITGLTRPAALAFAPGGDLLVAETGRLLRFAPVVARARD